MSVQVSDPTSALWKSIVFIQMNFPSGASYGGTGVMVGPNDVLTASHALYMPHEGGAATSVIVTPASWGGAPFGQVTSDSYHYYANYAGSGGLLMPGDGTPALSGSELDIGLINLSKPIGNQTGWMQLDPNFSGGQVNVTGFPAAYGWNMVNDRVEAFKSPIDNIVGYSGIALNPGNSGGPVWYDDGSGGKVVGVVSTGSWGASVKGVYNDLVSWINGNDHMIAGEPPLVEAPPPAPPAQTPPPVVEAPPVETPPPAVETPPPAPPAQTPPPVVEAPPVETPPPAPPAQTPPPVATPWNPTASGLAANLLDYTGDGMADIVLRHADGNVEVRTMSGAAVTGTHRANNYAGNDWTLEGTGDFNGDGKGDILWRHDGGMIAIWTMNGASVLDGSAVVDKNHSQHVVGVGDFNGDGRSDILWRGTDGIVSTTQVSDHSVSGGGGVGNMGADWNIQGVGDFNGDGRDDVLWRQDNGSVGMWLMDGTAQSTRMVGPGAPLDWHVAGIGDFNGDRNSDIAWQHESGMVSIWLMSGENVVGGWGTVPTNHPGWKLAGVGDFNNDQRADLLWQDASGAQTVELMNGLQIVGTAGVGTVGSDWIVA